MLDTVRESNLHCLQFQKEKRQKCGKANVRKMTENCVELMEDNNPKNHED